MEGCNIKNLSKYVISKGIPVYNGISEGKAVIVKTSKDFPKVQDKLERIILITNNFDPNYDILLDKCHGIVSELGNILCHLAIVSRIRRIPAIVNAQNITSLVKDGEDITIDAYNGIIYRGLQNELLSTDDKYKFIQDFYSKINKNNM